MLFKGKGKQWSDLVGRIRAVSESQYRYGLEKGTCSGLSGSLDFKISVHMSARESIHGVAACTPPPPFMASHLRHLREYFEG
jgi:hypothetical protein